MNRAGFVHLRVHSQYSLLDSTIRPEALAAAVRRLGMHACALTDRNLLSGAIEFYRACGRHAVKPILGAVLEVASDRSSGMGGGSGAGRRLAGGALTLLAATADGYRNLCRLATIAGTVEASSAPMVTWADLDGHREGLLALSGGLQGEAAVRFIGGDEAGAAAALRRGREVFGPESWFVELSDHGRDEDRRVLAFLRERAEQDGFPAVATNNVRYLERGDARAHEVLSCIGQRRLLRDPDRLREGSEEFYLKTPVEMRHRFAYAPEVVERTLAIADRIALDIQFDRHWLPSFPLPIGSEGEDAYLAQCASDGLRLRMGAPPEAYARRLAGELGVIQGKGFAGYFLIVADFIAEARRRGIPVGPGRGSAAGSLVAWSLGITEVDPLRYGLLFERFLNPERSSLPDIDVDVCQQRREEVIEYVRERYGHDRVAQIITFGTLGARAVLRDVARVMDLGVAETERIARLVPDGLKMTLGEAREKVPELAAAADGAQAELFSAASALEGLVRHASRHAAGVVIANVPITEVCPLYRDADGHIVTQYDMDSVQRLGLLKIDILGLRTLTVLESAARMAGIGDLEAATRGLDDPAVYALLAAGHGLGVFQLDSSGIRDLMVRVKPSCFGDLAALIALYRPGPIALADEFAARKHGRSPRDVVHPDLEPILEDTYGIVLYQEQVMEIAHRLAGFSLAEADELRAAMGKKIVEKMARLRERFLQGASRRGIAEVVATQLADLIERFAGYGFNKSHAVAYAVIAYRTAWLKVHHPVAFLSALLSSELGDRDKTALYVSEARRMGIEILPPDVNAPSVGFVPARAGGAGPGEAGRAIRVGLACVKGVGEGAAMGLTQEREAGAYTSAWDLVSRIDSRIVNRRALEALVIVGALDGLGPNRRSLLEALPALWDRASVERRSAEIGQLGLFGDASAEAPEMEEVPEFVDLAAREMEHLGFYLGQHPLLQRFPPAALMPVPSEEGETWGVGIVRGHEPTTDKKGRMMARLRLETRAGRREVIVFSNLYERARLSLIPDAVLVVSGKGEPGGRIVASRLAPVEELSWEVVLILPDGASADSMHELEILLATARPGSCSVFIDIPRERSRYRLKSPHRISLTHLMEKVAPARLAEIRVTPVFPENRT